ncbi:hypothetical protein [Rhizobium sp. 18065]|uniref:hypothetical protein n=1 Tax=Rhizobium sp. 18065 TaxID=2681411 RepID=UPI00135C82FE|nr:hypothetical protein [Rhizobium sp. 18065]
MTLTSVAKASAIYMLVAVLYSTGHVAMNSMSGADRPDHGVQMSLLTDAGH